MVESGAPDNNQQQEQPTQGVQGQTGSTPPPTQAVQIYNPTPWQPESAEAMQAAASGPPRAQENPTMEETLAIILEGSCVDHGDDYINEFLGEAGCADVEKRTEQFNIVAHDFSTDVGKKESRRERSERGLKDIQLTYGEIEFKSFFQVFKWIQAEWKDKDSDCWHNAFNNPGGTFVDLGHGSGKGILSGAFMHQFERCWGIEILESLQNVSINLKAEYDKYISEHDPQVYQEIFGWPLAAAPRFEVVLGDIFEHQWADADMLFCNSTCFTNPMMEQIYNMALKCKKGSWFATMSKRLPHAEVINDENPARDDIHWQFILAIKLKMSWGKATVNLHRKRTHPVQ